MKTKIIPCLITIAFITLFLYECKKDDSNPSIIELPGNTVFDFESGLQSWYSENTNMTLVYNTDKEFVLHGQGSVKGTCNITGTNPLNARANIRWDTDPGIDMTGLTLQFYVFIPGSLANLSLKYGTKLWIVNTGAIHWYTIEGPEISKSGWNHYSFTPTATDVNSIECIVFQIYKNDGTEEDWSGDIYYDYFSW